MVNIELGAAQATISNLLPVNLDYHPQVAFLQAQKHVEGMFHMNDIAAVFYPPHNFLNPRIFDTNKWTAYENISISEFVQEQLKINNINHKLTANEIFCRIYPEKNQDRHWSLQNAANIWVYFYFSSHSEVDIQTFLSQEINKFTQSLATKYPQKTLTIEKNTFLLRCQQAKSFQELHSLLEAFSPTDKLSLEACCEIEVAMNIYLLFIEKYQLANSAHNALIVEIKPIIDSNPSYYITILKL